MIGDILDRLVVWSDQRIVGELGVDRGGAMHVTYAPQWLEDPSARALSHALPKQNKAFADALCKAVFGGVLPEERQRTAIAQALGVSTDNLFRLLAALGGDVAGALAFLPDGKPLPHSSKDEPANPLDDEALADLIGRLSRAQMLARGRGHLAADLHTVGAR